MIQTIARGVLAWALLYTMLAQVTLIRGLLFNVKIWRIFIILKKEIPLAMERDDRTGCWKLVVFMTHRGSPPRGRVRTNESEQKLGLQRPSCAYQLFF